MKYARFEDLPVWKNAIELAERIYQLTKGRFFSQPGDLRDQLRRAALSVSNNVAEGFERGSTAELLMFIYIARGSAGEVRSMLRLCDRMTSQSGSQNPEAIRQPTNPAPAIRNSAQVTDNPVSAANSNLKSEISNLRSEIAALIKLAESCSRQLRGWADSLQNSDIQGQRHLNDKSRAGYDQQRRAEAFRREIEQRFRDAHPELFKSPDSDSQT